MLLLAANHNEVCLLLKTNQVSFHSTEASIQSLFTWLPYEEMRSWKKEEKRKKGLETSKLSHLLDKGLKGPPSKVAGWMENYVENE